jgi:hypothetical protein
VILIANKKRVKKVFGIEDVAWLAQQIPMAVFSGLKTGFKNHFY